MTTLDRELPRSASRPSVVGRATMAVLERVLPGIEGGTLALQLPDGSERRFGAGGPEVTMRIDDWRLLDRIARSPRLALGESYQAGEWRSHDLVPLLELLLRNAAAGGERHRWWRRFAELQPRVNRRTGLLAARRNIARHYDLGNDLFRLFLDETMTYSCALFEPGDTLADAQRRKLRTVCEKLDLGPGDHVLEIGCGWGSFALTAARDYGARVTAVTISGAQATLARERIADAGLSDRVEVVERDFRELSGSYTAIASIEMLEAVGERLWRPFFAQCDRLLAEGGRACIQTIVVPDDKFRRYRSSPDWIERHVFPGCLIPSRGALRGALAPARLRITDDEEIGLDYAETLRQWRERFHASLARVRALGYDERFIRTWDFYLASCEALFRTETMRDAQLVLTR